MSLEGTLDVDLRAGDEVEGRYRVVGGDQDVELAATTITATATVAASQSWADDVWFPSTWAPTFPFTYTMLTTVVADGAVAQIERLDATCTADGADAEVTVVLLDPATPPEDQITSTTAAAPAPDPVVITPRFTG